LQQKIKLKGYYDLYQQIARKGKGFLVGEAGILLRKLTENFYRVIQNR
jgi:hypothetical protein